MFRAVLLIYYSAFCVCLLGSDWPNWRGPFSDGATAAGDYAVSFDRTNNVVWRVELPERGNSSPIVWKDRIFVTQAVGKRRTVICVDRRGGKILWQSGPTYELPETTMQESNPYCAASPVTDGKRVIAFF